MAKLDGFSGVSETLVDVVDGLVDLVGQIPRLFGVFFRPIQNGLVQFYAVAMMLGVTVFLVVILFKYGW